MELQIKLENLYCTEIENSKFYSQYEYCGSCSRISFLAKPYRDEYIDRFMRNTLCTTGKKQGYPTKEHREAIRKYGVTKYHRMSFRLPEQYSFDL
jgi:ribonuclease HII